MVHEAPLMVRYWISFTDATENNFINMVFYYLTAGRIEIGRYPATDVLKLSPLGTGTTLASFQSEGKIPEASDRLNNSVRLGAILYAVDLSILGVMSSGPDDLDTSRLMSMSAT